MTARVPTALLAALLLALPAAADTVRLTNGRAFEDVVAEVAGEQVRIRMPYGEIVLPMSSVAEISRTGSALADYLERRAALRGDEAAPARAWLELARWSRARGVDHGVREAALTAAALEPELDGLAPLLRELGYVIDDELGRWVPYSDYMQRRGFVYAEGRWIGPGELAERERRRREALEEAEARRRAERADRVADIAELLLVQELLEQETEPPVAVPMVYATPAPVVGIHHRPHGLSSPRGAPSVGGAPAVTPAAGLRFQANRQALPGLTRRQPGSILPIGGDSHRGGMKPAPGGQ